MICSAASFVSARDSESDHIPAHKTDTTVLSAAVHEMKTLYFSFWSIVGALRMQYETWDMNELPNPSRLSLFGDFDLQVCLSFGYSWI